jgi:hypothetical protein
MSDPTTQASNATAPVRDAHAAATIAAVDPLEVSDPQEVLMNSRYLTNVALTIAGAFLVVASQAFAVSTFEWLMFGIGVLAVLLAATIVLDSRGPAQNSLDGIIGILGAWTILASLVFAGSTVTWLGFASGAGFVALAVIGLTLHELSTERVVHSIEVRAASPEQELAGVH